MSSSESFFTKSDDMTSSVQFSERTTLSSRGYSLLVKAKRYGRWWLLKGLKEEYRHDGIFQAFLQKEYDILSMAMERLKLFARAYSRFLKVARTIADLAGSEKVKSMHIAEAIGYSNLDRGDWAERGI